MAANLKLVAEHIRLMNPEELNEVARLLNAKRRHNTAMRVMAYHVGDRVEFETRGGRWIMGTVIRVNRKTCSLDADDGGKWRVSPNFMRMKEEAGGD